MSKVITVRFNDDELAVLYKVMTSLGSTNKSRTIKLVLIMFDLIFLEGLSLAELLKTPKDIMELIEAKSRTQRPLR